MPKPQWFLEYCSLIPAACSAQAKVTPSRKRQSRCARRSQKEPHRHQLPLLRVAQSWLHEPCHQTQPRLHRVAPIEGGPAIPRALLQVRQPIVGLLITIRSSGMCHGQDLTPRAIVARPVRPEGLLNDAGSLPAGESSQSEACGPKPHHHHYKNLHTHMCLK